MSDRDHDTESKGCPSCQAVAATWIGGCDNPIHIHQANAHILYLEQQVVNLTQEQDDLLENLSLCKGNELAEQLTTAQARIAELEEAAEMLWITLANVSLGDWSKQSPEWQQAAARYRDLYFKTLPPSTEAQP